MTKKSILYIITKSVWGGAAKYVYDLSINLSGDFDVSIAAGGKDKLYKKAKKANIPYYKIINFQRTINPLKDVFAFFEILSLLFQLKPDVIHVNSSKAGGIVGVAGWCYRVFSNKKIKLIFTAHGWAINEDRSKYQIKLIKFFSKITSIFYDKIICVSEYDRQIAIKNKITCEKKLITIHNGIDIKNINFLSKEQAQKKLFNLSAGDLTKEGKTYPLVIGTIAEWTRNKGLKYLLKAIKRIKNKRINVILIGSGENPDKEKMYELTERHKNINLIEYIPNAVKYIKAFDIFVLPSIKEGLPYTILEAISAKVPVIATNVGGIPEILSSNLIQSKNSRILAEKITELIDEINNNPEKIKRTIQENRNKAEQEFNIEKMIEKTKNLY